MTDRTLVRLMARDGTWDAFVADWTHQCATYGEDFSQYASGSMPVLRDLAHEDKADAGVFALDSDGRYDAVAQVNSTLLPGYVGKVLRVRHMLLSPNFDLGEYSIDDYARVLSRMFQRTIALSDTVYPSPHIKFHLRSPADRQFFSYLGNEIDSAGLFASVQLRGSWLYLTKKTETPGTETERGTGL